MYSTNFTKAKGRKKTPPPQSRRESASLPRMNRILMDITYMDGYYLHQRYDEMDYRPTAGLCFKFC